MIREELEFRIARYADGDLTEAERLAVEAELASDAEARALLAEYQTLRTAIEEAAGPALPKVHWDRLEQLLSTAVAQAAPGIASETGDGEAGDGPFAAALGIENEFAIACHANGTLAPEDRAEVEQLLVSDARARALLNEYHDLDAAIKALAYSDAPPSVRWDRLAVLIGRVVDAGANGGFAEDIERQIAEYSQGALPADESDSVEARLATDPAARIRECEYRTLDAALRAMPSADPLPAVDWERFACRISAAIDRQAVQVAVRSGKPRQGAYSILKWLGSPTRMALAASVLIGVALTARLMHGRGGVPPNPAFPSKPAPIEQIAVLQPEAPAGAAQSEIAIGPPAVARADNDDDYAAETGDDEVVSRPPRAFVASGRATAGGADVLPAIPF